MGPYKNTGTQVIGLVAQENYVHGNNTVFGNQNERAALQGKEG
jgi:hypothetical protein